MEIMAPVGSWESLQAAIQAGAGSIYFGVEQLNMRVKSAASLTIGDIPEIVSRCAAHGMNSYLTLNTTMYDHDRQLVSAIIREAKASGVSAIIAADFAVIKECKKQGISLHISTQANVTNIDTVEFFAEYADLIVLSRELTLKQVKDIVREIKTRDIRGPKGELVRIEVFAHGALCMAVSGKCYLSLDSNNSSANRGACVQNCRHKYLVTDIDSGKELEIDNEYIMSAKDLCTIDFLDTIADAGVSVLKIEGRGRSADYVYTTVKCYKEAVLALANGTYTQERITGWKAELSTVFNRGFWDGYYMGKQLGEWSNTDGSQATKKKIFLGKAVKYYPRIGVAEFALEAGSVAIGDELLLTGPLTGIISTKAETVHLNTGAVDIAEKGSNCSIPFAEKVRPGDKLYKIVATEYA
ncbi:MAG: peptidase U32 family protein [Bacteroidota bacterium]